MPEQALEVLSALRQIDPHVSVWLFGSWARGTGGAASDVDLLVGLSSQSRIEEARSACLAARTSALVTTEHRLTAFPKTAPLFNLHLGTEAVRLVGHGRLPRVAWRATERQHAVRRAGHRLKAAHHELDVWGASDDASQAMFFAAVKEWAMVATACEGRPQFDRWSALRRALPLARRHEAALQLLENVWLCKRDRQPVRPIDDPEGIVQRVNEVLPAHG